MMDVFGNLGEGATSPGVASFGTFEQATNSAKPAGRKVKLAAVGPHGLFTVRGQTAKALAALIAAGPRGVTAQEVAGWAFRFAAYCHVLRRKRGLSIETLREKHEGGWHGRHVLLSAVTIIDGGAKHG
jgi:hypothetical protein